jgi:replicative DNA helicase
MIFENEPTQNGQRRNRINNPTPYSGLGKLPPQEISLEDAILGSIISENIPSYKWQTLRTEMFYKDANQKIFNAINLLQKDKKAIDELTVVAKLKSLGELEMVGGIYAITKLAENISSSSLLKIEYHILIVHQAFLKRELIRISSECINNAYEDTIDPLEAIKSIVKEVKDLERGIFKRQEKNAKELTKEAIAEMETEKIDGLLGESSGLTGLDYVIKGIRKSHLIVIPGATSMGKSLLMCSLIKNCCFNQQNNLLEKQIPVAVFSLEMKSVELTFRLIGNISDVPCEKIELNNMDSTERYRVKEAFQKFEQSKIYIDDTPGISINELEIKIAIMVALYDIREVFIDYIQLIKFDKSVKSQNREEGFSDVSKRLKTLASELDISIIVFSQVTDEVKTRHLKIPLTDDIKYCKAIGNDADLLMFLWRADYYPDVLEKVMEAGIFISLFGFSMNDFTSTAFLIITKHRGGKLGKIPLKFKPEIMRVSDHSLVLDAINSMNSNQTELTTEERPVNF